jgi:hypothetical protein
MQVDGQETRKQLAAAECQILRWFDSCKLSSTRVHIMHLRRWISVDEFFDRSVATFTSRTTRTNPFSIGDSPG